MIVRKIGLGEVATQNSVTLHSDSKKINEGPHYTFGHWMLKDKSNISRYALIKKIYQGTIMKTISNVTVLLMLTNLNIHVSNIWC